jgi:antitoxin PrlF
MPDNQKKRTTRTKANPEEKANSRGCCESTAPGGGCCVLHSLVSIDARGQMILPKEIRDKANIRAGDKLAVTSLEKDGKVCCIILTKADELSGMVKIMLGPVMKDVL